MKLNPVFKKEIISGSRSVKIPLTMFAINSILALIMVINLASTASDLVYSGSVDSLIYRMKSYREFCFFVLITIFVVLFLFVPNYTASLLASERENQTFEMLITSSFPLIRIVLGKLLAGLSILYTILFSAMPLLVVMMVFYSVRFKNILYLVTVMMVLGIYLAAISTFTALKAKNSKTAIAQGFIGVLSVIFGTMCIIIAIYVSRELRINWNYYFHDGFRTDVEMGAEKYIFLLNPVLLAADVIYRIMGKSNGLMSMLNTAFDAKSSVDVFVIDNWSVICCVLYLIISMLLIIASSLRVDVLRKGKNRYLKRRRSETF